MKRTPAFLALLLCWLASAAAEARPVIAVDAPQWDATVNSGFTLSGWAADLSSPTGAGIGAIDVWAFPNSGSAVPLGTIRAFSERPDVASAFGSRFLVSGFRLPTAALAPGSYQVLFYPYTVAKGGIDFTAVAVLRITIAGTTTSGTKLKVVSWNTHHGTDTAGACSVDRIADWIVRMGANVVILNEVEKGTGWCSGQDQPARYTSLLTSRTGKTWYSNFAQRDGLTNGQGNLILTTFPLEASGDHVLSYSRSVARGQIVVNGIRVNVFGTHLDADSSSRRTTQMNELKNWADNYPEQRIIAGDFNAWPGAAEIANMTSGHFDGWAVAAAQGIATAYAGNTAGNTRNSRIDYVWYSRGASRLVIRGAQVFDIRQSNGVSPSDHRPVMVTLEVR
jgi:endonuclease/exonuclease/phosphatase family metal-dependent hydrolase